MMASNSASVGESDGIAAVFTSADAALAAACSLQQAFMREPWPPETLIRVRMGLHTGQASPREGRYEGAPVNRAAQIRSLAQGGQILLSRVTHDMLHTTLPDGISLLPIGTHTLGGLERPEEIYQVSHPQPLPCLLHSVPPGRPSTTCLA